MTFDKNTKQITINRGSRGTIKLTNTTGNFKMGDTIKLSIVKKNNYKEVLLQKEYTVKEESATFNLTLLPDDTRFGEVISREKTYWYEIEYNNEYPLIAFDKDGEKEFILYPEAPNKEEGKK